MNNNIKIFIYLFLIIIPVKVFAAYIPAKPMLWGQIVGAPDTIKFIKYTDTNTFISTVYNIQVENKAMKDTANAIRASIPSVAGYLSFLDTSILATKYNIYLENKAMKDSIAVLRALIGPELPDYTNTASTTGGAATFYLTHNKLSSGTALYNQINHISPIVNNANAYYTFGWTISGDNKTLTINSKVATNTAVLTLLGIAVTGAATTVPNGTNIQVLVKGQ